MPKQVELYDLATGQVLQRHSLTATEAVANGRGRYVLQKPSAWPPKELWKEPSAPENAGGETAVAAAPSADPGADGPDGAELLPINGIGPGIARQLAAAGFETIEDIAEATPDEIAGVLKLPGKTPDKIAIAAADWIAQARNLA